MSPNPNLSPDRIMQLGLGFWGAKTLLSAVELGLFTELALGPLRGEALRQRLGLHERGAQDFFDALVALGMLDRDDGRYMNTAESDHYLDRNKPSYIGGMLEMVNARTFPAWGSLTEALRTGEPQNETKGSANPFLEVYADPARLELFLRAMTGLSRPIAEALAEQFPWRKFKTFIDIGTAEGSVPVALAQAHPHLSGGGFDLPPVKPWFERHVDAHGLADRLRFQSGDFLDQPLPRADVLVFGHILHDWDLAMKRRLLAKAHRALPDGGALIVYDRIIDNDRREHAAGLLMSLNMLVATPGGFDYTAADCQGWLEETGFVGTYVEPLIGPYSMIVGLK